MWVPKKYRSESDWLKFAGVLCLLTIVFWMGLAIAATLEEADKSVRDTIQTFDGR